ncbi:hypothetical protein PVAND_003065 [Polypedilum vanderplanki]|uniref:Transmembrane protein 141 n=1 Tax=Polypedilum vanderplanki TaxID=319348 RepID=A0A9J6BTT3_POLVA|nr:hypothetical protein PVAND_003065 [Polypedilum vanderplanki]
MNDIRRLKEQQKDKHPGFGSYLECMTRALFSGLAGFTLGFSSVYFTQKFLQKRFPHQLQTNILISTLVGSFAAYKVTSERTKSCQAAWLAVEEKHTALSDH